MASSSSIAALRFHLRLVAEPAHERCDATAVARERRHQREIASRRFVFLRKRRDEATVAQMLADHWQAAERDALPADGRLHDLVVDAKAQRARRFQSRLAV